MTGYQSELVNRLQGRIHTLFAMFNTCNVPFLFNLTSASVRHRQSDEN